MSNHFEMQSINTTLSFNDSKLGPNTAEWIKTRETADIPSVTTTDIKSTVDYAENKTREDSIDVEEIIIGETQKDFDSAKSGVARAWDHTKDMAGNVTHSACNMGSDICDAVKHGAEAGWNKVAGD